MIQQGHISGGAEAPMMGPIPGNAPESPRHWDMPGGVAGHVDMLRRRVLELFIIYFLTS